MVKTAVFAEPGVLTESGNAMDMAIRGEGYFLLRNGDTFFLSRGGQFRRDRDGLVVDGQGRVLQQAGGGDLQLDTDAPQILADGTVLSDQVPVGSIGVYLTDTSIDPERFPTGISREEASALGESQGAEIAQGMIERSNVVLSDEMIGLMRSQRLAEAGAQLVRAYDQLTGQAVSTFGRRGG